MEKTICLFGDSIAYGFWDLEGGWAGRLRKLLDNRVLNSEYEDYFKIYNLGIDGDTSKGLLNRFEQETKSRRVSGEELLFLFHIGDNDSIFDNEKKDFLISRKLFEENIRKLISKAKKYSDKIVFVGSTPVDETKVDPIPWTKNCSYKNKYLSEFRRIIEKICKETKCYFVDLSLTVDKNDFMKCLPDGIHPITEGYKITFMILKKFLEKEGLI